MSENDDHSPTPTPTLSESIRRVVGQLHTQGGSDETLSDTIGSTRHQTLGESPKNVESASPASETHFLISPTSPAHGTGSHHGEDNKWKKSTVLVLLLYTAIGTFFAIGHHILYETLSHHATLAVSLQIGPFTIGPTWALTIGNGLSWLVQLFYTLSIGGALVQLFWHLLHTRHLTLREMDRVFSITSTFYTRTALRRATGLAVVAMVSLGIGGVISTFAPPSLSISIRPVSQPCDIMTVDFSYGPPSYTSTPLANLAAHVLLTQSPMPPGSSPCSNCTYNVTYFAPALTCKEIDMASSPFHPDPVDRVVLWNATYALSDISWEFDMYMLSRTGNTLNVVFSDPQIIMCTLQNATYKITIDHRNGTNVTAETDIVSVFHSDTWDPPSVNVSAAYESIGDAFGEFISGSVEVIPPPRHPQHSIFNIDIIKSSFVSYAGWIACQYPLGNCTRNIDLLTALPTLMQHMSVSLLAGNVAGDDGASSLSRVPDGRCLNESAVYVYDRVRLLAVYGSALLVTSVCVAMGIHSVLVGQGSTLKFSNLVYAIMTPEMIEISNGQELPQDTVIHAVRGRFVPGYMV